jgi:hypothetical protein
LEVKKKVAAQTERRNCAEESKIADNHKIIINKKRNLEYGMWKLWNK